MTEAHMSRFSKMGNYKDNIYQLQYQEYLDSLAASGKAPSTDFYKADDDGDPRYVGAKWYQDRAKGRVGAWDVDDKTKLF